MSSALPMDLAVTHVNGSAMLGHFNMRYYLNQFWMDNCDPRTRDLMFMREGPWSLATVLLTYLILVTKVIPGWMKNRKPMELRGPMLGYNILMVAINAFFLIQASRWLSWGRKLTDFRFPSPEDRSDEAMTIVYQFHLYFLTKFVDFLDTFFFVFRKKYAQISTLHLYHHVAVPIIGWISLWIGPTMPVLGLFSVLNCFVHVVMYSYYALASFGPEVQKFLWWKKYITQIQLIQFAVIFIYACFLLKFQTGYPLIYKMMPTFQAPIFFFMFYKFYRRSYRSQKKAAAKSN